MSFKTKHSCSSWRQTRKNKYIYPRANQLLNFLFAFALQNFLFANLPRHPPWCTACSSGPDIFFGEFVRVVESRDTAVRIGNNPQGDDKAGETGRRKGILCCRSGENLNCLENICEKYVDLFWSVHSRSGTSGTKGPSLFQLSYADIAFYFNSEWPSFLQVYSTQVNFVFFGVFWRSVHHAWRLEPRETQHRAPLLRTMQ